MIGQGVIERADTWEPLARAGLVVWGWKEQRRLHPDQRWSVTLWLICAWSGLVLRQETLTLPLFVVSEIPGCPCSPPFLSVQWWANSALQIPSLRISIRIFFRLPCEGGLILTQFLPELQQNFPSLVSPLKLKNGHVLSQMWPQRKHYPRPFVSSFSLTHLEHNQLWVLIQNMYISLCARGSWKEEDIVKWRRKGQKRKMMWLQVNGNRRASWRWNN